MGRHTAVCLDLDDTLLTYRRGPAELLATSFEQCSVRPFFSLQEYYDRFDDFAGEFATIEAIRRACFEGIAVDHSRDPAVGRELAAAYSAERDHANVELLPGAERVLEHLAAEHRLGLITNGPRESQSIKLEAAGIADWFDTTVFAGDGVPAKPDPEPFERALDEIAVTADEAVHIGDSLESDVVGAHNAGMEAVWITEASVSPAVEPTYRVEAVAEVLELTPFR